MSKRGRNKKSKKDLGDSAANFSGFEDKSGPLESIDLSDVKEELVSVAEGEDKVAISTPLVTPVSSPDRQACVESGSVKKSKEIFESLEKAENKVSTKVARELVVPTTEGLISPIKPEEKQSGVSTTVQSYFRTTFSISDTDSSDTESLASENDIMVVDEETGQKFCEKLAGLVKAAEDDIAKAKVLYRSPDRTPAALRAMQSRLDTWDGRLIKQEREVHTYRGKSIDISTYISLSEDARMEVIEQKIYMDEAVKEVVAVIAKPLVAPGVRIVKTTASSFPEFDGVIDYEIWETIWTELANNSGLSQAGLLIKLRESLVDRAKNYIGVSGMANLTYDQTWEKLKERYAVSWAKTQQASRNFFSIPPPTNDDQSIINYVDAVRDAVDAVERAVLTPENIFFNICLDNLPERVRVPLVEKLEVHCEDFKFSKALFEKQFSKTMSLLENKPKSIVASMYSANLSSSTPAKPFSGNNKVSYTQSVSHNPSQGNQQYQYQGGNRGGGSGFKNGFKKFPACTLCFPVRHFIKDCKYKTPSTRRKRLIDIGRCQACLTPVREHGEHCSHKARCPDHSGERHVPWTCEGAGSTHPGPQTKFPLPVKSKPST